MFLHCIVTAAENTFIWKVPIIHLKKVLIFIASNNIALTAYQRSEVIVHYLIIYKNLCNSDYLSIKARSFVTYQIKFLLISIII